MTTKRIYAIEVLTATKGGKPILRTDIVFMAAALASLFSSLEAAQPLSNANLNPADVTRLAAGIPDFSKLPGRTVLVDPVASTNRAPTLTPQVAAPSVVISSDLPAVFERSTDLTGWSDALFGTRIVVSPSQSGSNPTQFVRAHTALEPVAVYVPERYYSQARSGDEKGFPLVLAFHGYTGTARDLLTGKNWGLTNLSTLAEERGFLLAVPQRGTVDSSGATYFNATSGCCDFDRKNRPDIDWSLAALDAIRRALNVDTNAIFALGLSNGGYVAAQLAAQTDSRFAAVAVLSGRCAFPNEMPPRGNQVSVLFVCGKADEVASYSGGNFGAGFNYPGAVQSAQFFADRYGLTKLAVATNSLDILRQPDGAETTVMNYGPPDGSPRSVEVELWTHPSTHNPPYTPEFAGLVVDWLFKHRRVAPTPHP